MTSPYPKEPISPLRARMIEDMRMRNFVLATLRNTVEGGHRLRWKADTRMVIADT